MTHPERMSAEAQGADMRGYFQYEGVPNGRLLAISALLRCGHPIARVVDAVRLADKGDIEGAIAALMPAALTTQEAEDA